MNDLWPVTIITDRYLGTYSGALWLAFPTYPEVVGQSEAQGGDIECMEYFDTERPIGKGQTPDEALADLHHVLDKMKLTAPVGAHLLVD